MSCIKFLNSINYIYQTNVMVFLKFISFIFYIKTQYNCCRLYFFVSILKMVKYNFIKC